MNLMKGRNILMNNKFIIGHLDLKIGHNGDYLIDFHILLL